MSSDQVTVQVQPTDVWVTLRTGTWNVTSPDFRPFELSVTTRSILKGLLLAGIDALDEVDA